MADLGNYRDINDYLNVRDSWLSSMGKSNKRVRVHIFLEYESVGNKENRNETFRRAKYASRFDHAFLSNVKVFDTVKGGYFTTGDLDVYTEYPLRGFSAAYSLPNGVQIPEYAGDLIEWNGKFWEVADQLEPVTAGVVAKQVWYRTVLRKTNRAGIGLEVGP